MTVLDVGGTPVRCRLTSGPAHRPPVVLLHGAGASHESWCAVQQLLQGEVRSVAFHRYDLPSAATHRERALLTGSVLDALGWDPPYVLVGHSWGGALARTFAEHRPADVAALVLADATHEGLRELSRLPFRLLVAAARLRGGPVGREIAGIPKSVRTLTTAAVPTVALTGSAFTGGADRRRRADVDRAHRAWAARHQNVGHVRVPDAGHDLPGRAAGVLAQHILATLNPVVLEETVP